MLRIVNIRICVLFLYAVTVNSLKVYTSEGIVVGRQASDGNYVVFYGVPYAGSVSGENRYKAPPPPPRRERELNATNKVVCAPNPYGVEDCLTLNIYTKDENPGKPVIVWVQGEDYAKTNSHPYSHKTYVEQDIVAIEVNYRLSIFGFLCLRNKEAPGNAGLKDVLQALKWIKSNVKNFGGDPNNVLLIGHGSGAAMVELLTLSQQSNNLIKKAIAMSGSALSPWAIAYNPEERARNISNIITGKAENITSINNITKTLLTANLTTLINAINKAGNTFPDQTVLFAPCLENKNLAEPILTDAPLDVIKSQNYNDISYIAGFVAEEGTMRINEAVNDKWLEGMEKNFTDFLPVNMKFDSWEVKNNITKDIRTKYFDGKVINRDAISNYLNYEGEVLVSNAVIKSAKERAKTARKPVRLLAVMYKEDRSIKWPHPDVTLNGLEHGRIMDYFLNDETESVSKKQKQFLVKRTIAFAKSDIPTSTDGSEPGDVTWKHITTQHLNYLKIPAMASDGEPREFLVQDPPVTVSWESFYGDHYLPPVYVSSSPKILVSIFALTLFLFLIL